VTEKQPPPSTATTQETKPPVIIQATPTTDKQKTSEDETVAALNEMQENAGQISELTTEEESLVQRFFDSLLKILKPFGKTLEISASALPERYNGRLNKAYLYLTGQLVLVYTNGEVEILNLIDQENHDILVELTGEVMQKLKSMINAYRVSTEKRVKFLMVITKEMQKIAEVFSEK
jgi:hypothetical protein